MPRTVYFGVGNSYASVLVEERNVNFPSYRLKGFIEVAWPGNLRQSGLSYSEHRPAIVD
jgi:hypothetical protein